MIKSTALFGVCCAALTALALFVAPSDLRSSSASTSGAVASGANFEVARNTASIRRFRDKIAAEAAEAAAAAQQAAA